MSFRLLTEFNQNPVKNQYFKESNILTNKVLSINKNQIIISIHGMTDRNGRAILKGPR